MWPKILYQQYNHFTIWIWCFNRKPFTFEHAFFESLLRSKCIDFHCILAVLVSCYTSKCGCYWELIINDISGRDNRGLDFWGQEILNIIESYLSFAYVCTCSHAVFLYVNYGSGWKRNVQETNTSQFLAFNIKHWLSNKYIAKTRQSY